MSKWKEKYTPRVEKLEDKIVNIPLLIAQNQE